MAPEEDLREASKVWARHDSLSKSPWSSEVVPEDLMTRFQWLPPSSPPIDTSSDDLSSTPTRSAAVPSSKRKIIEIDLTDDMPPAKKFNAGRAVDAESVISLSSDTSTATEGSGIRGALGDIKKTLQNLTVEVKYIKQMLNRKDN
jgi:hypothetical protein